MTTWRLDDARQTLVLAQQGKDLPQIVYWGAALPSGEDLETLAAVGVIDVTGGMMDQTAPLSVCPEARHAWPGQPGFEILGSDGCRVLPRLQCAAVKVAPDGTRLDLHAEDPEAGVTYNAQIALTRDGCVQTQARVQAPGCVVAWLSAPVLPVPSDSDGLIDFSGRWIGEFRREHHSWRPGVHLREARQGRSGHEHPPFAIVTTPGVTNTSGVAYAYSYDWSGGHRMIAEELPDGRRQLQFGHATGSFALGSAQTATLTACFSDAGLNGCARQFQARIRKMTCSTARQPRPVHYNCWEAVYFDHSESDLREIARHAADLGAERFVLDDGWFGKRDDDTTSLGDWQIDPRKWPDGLAPFARHVQTLGMRFGLWVEPEMVNFDSDLHRAHPDWLLGPADQPPGRQQYVLDLAQEAVRDHLFQRLDEILASAPIEYLKWDHNRLLPVIDAAQTEGLYALLARLTAAHPEVEIETCASGGGRIDLGILAHTQRVWLSDSNDALERLRIQHEAALFLPAAVTGSHVGPRVCHTSGRVMDMAFRAWVAAQRHMGFEMDPRELTPTEADTLRAVTQWWKDNRHWMMEADILRLDHADPAVIAEQHLAADGGRFVAFAGAVTPSTQIAPRPLRLTGLQPDALYEVSLANRDDAVRLSRGPMRLKQGPVRLSGQSLMSQGLALPWRFAQTMWVLEGTRLT